MGALMNLQILDFGKPKIEGVGFDIKETIYENPGSLKVNLMAPEGMQNVFVEILSDNEGFLNTAAGALGGVTSFDLAHPETQDVEDALKGLGFPVGDAIIGNRNVVLFDISLFVGFLFESTFAGEHTFKIKVVDSYGDYSEESLVIDSSSIAQ